MTAAGRKPLMIASATAASATKMTNRAGSPPEWLTPIAAAHSPKRPIVERRMTLISRRRPRTKLPQMMMPAHIRGCMGGRPS